jgi:hypothetical protein
MSNAADTTDPITRIQRPIKSAQFREGTKQVEQPPRLVLRLAVSIIVVLLF